MPRRRSGLQPLHLAGAVVFLALAGGAWWLFGRGKDPKLTGNPLPGDQYADNKTVRGNTYLLTGTILQQLRFGSDSSRLFSVEVKDSGNPNPVAVLVPGEFSGLNIQVGQEFQMEVIEEKNTVLRAKDIKKS